MNQKILAVRVFKGAGRETESPPFTESAGSIKDPFDHDFLHNGHLAASHEKHPNGVGDSVSVSGSVTTSSATSTTSDANSVREFKASLYERKNPFTVRLLKYTIWLLYGVLFTSCTVDWVISYLKADETQELFRLVNGISHRVDYLCEISLNVRTLDLVVRGLETNRYYDDNEDSFYHSVYSDVIILQLFLLPPK